MRINSNGCIFILYFFITGCKSNTPVAELRVFNKDIDMGNIRFDSNYYLSYIIRNIGTAPLVIDTITSSCGCSTPQLSKKMIQPEDTGKVTVAYKPVDTGRFSKSLVIKSNSNKKFTILTFKGSSR